MGNANHTMHAMLAAASPALARCIAPAGAPAWPLLPPRCAPGRHLASLSRGTLAAGGTKCAGRQGRRAPAAPNAALEALIFDCDGVILLSEDLHRRAYNTTFRHFDVVCPGGGAAPVEWDSRFYDELQNKIGGGKPKMRWYFKEHGWPRSRSFPEGPKTPEEETALIDELQDWKSEEYRRLIAEGADPRPGVVELMDEARRKGKKLAVCSAATRSSVVFTLSRLLGKERFEALDCFLAGDDVKEKKPDPSIYVKAAEKLGVAPADCLVIEDSSIGLQAAMDAGMPCVVTYTASTESQEFRGAVKILSDLSESTLETLESLHPEAAKI